MHTKLDRMTISEEATFEEGLCKIDQNGCGVLFVLDAEKHVVGSLSDGDIRRAFLRHIVRDGLRVSEIMNRAPKVVDVSVSDETIRDILDTEEIRYIPRIDKSGAILEILSHRTIQAHKHEGNMHAVILCGGLGSRLGSLTKDCPKPMIQIGNQPILQTIIHQLRDYGVRHFFLAVNYLSHMIEDCFGNGESLGVKIEYIHEKKPLGTAGALCLIDRMNLNAPVIIMNGDILTRVNFREMMAQHVNQQAKLTMAIKKVDRSIPYGVVTFDSGRRTVDIVEKPKQHFFINAGIYIVNPELFSLIPRGIYFDMTNFIETITAEAHPIDVFPVHEYWADIGTPESLESASNVFFEHFPATSTDLPHPVM